MNTIKLSSRPVREPEFLNKGRYLVIDPCYVLGQSGFITGEADDVWNRFCDEILPIDERNNWVIQITVGNKTYDVVCFSTAYGDGCYPVFDSGVELGHCGVDAGLLSFIPDKLIKEIGGDNYLGVWINIPSKFMIQWTGEGKWDRGGDARVGNIVICTCGCMIEDDVVR